MSTRPAELLGIDAGTLKPGAAADFALVDLDYAWVVDPEELQSRSKNTTFEAARMTGKVIKTAVAGRMVYEA